MKLGMYLAIDIVFVVLVLAFAEIRVRDKQRELDMCRDHVVLLRSMP